MYDGDGDNGIESYYEDEADRQACLHPGEDHGIPLKENDPDQYVIEG